MKGRQFFVMRTYYTGVFLILLSAFGFGMMPILALFAYQDGMNVPTLLFMRFFLASACLFAYTLLRRIDWAITPRQLFYLFLMGGVLYTFQSTFYFSSVKLIPASLAVLILYLYPVLVAMLAVIVDKEKLSGKIIAPAILALAGLAIVLGSPVGNLNFFGVALAFGAAVIYSVYIILGRRVVAQVSPIVTTAFIAAFAALSFLVYGWVDDALQFDFTLHAWFIILGVVLFSTVLAMATFFAGMNIIGPTRASILSTIEPVITFGFSAMLLDEKLSWVQGIGAALVLLGAIWVIRQRSVEAA